jgi:hypothetical protein
MMRIWDDVASNGESGEEGIDSDATETVEEIISPASYVSFFVVWPIIDVA